MATQIADFSTWSLPFQLRWPSFTHHLTSRSIFTTTETSICFVELSHNAVDMAKLARTCAADTACPPNTTSVYAWCAWCLSRRNLSEPSRGRSIVCSMSRLSRTCEFRRSRALRFGPRLYAVDVKICQSVAHSMGCAVCNALPRCTWVTILQTRRSLSGPQWRDFRLSSGKLRRLL